MKKLMFAVSAAFCATVGFSDVTSANVVGYQNITRSANFVYSGSTFAEPGKDFFLLNNVKVADADDEGLDLIQFLTPGTSRLSNFDSYYFDGDVWCHAITVPGQCMVDDELEEDYPIPVGNGFLARFSTVGAKFLYAGEVNVGSEGKVSVPRTQDFQLIINPLPYPVDLMDVTVEGADDEGADLIQFFIEGTSRLSNFDSYYFDGDVWCHAITVPGQCMVDDEIERGDVVIQPGEGFMLRCATPGAVVKFPAPKL